MRIDWIKWGTLVIYSALMWALWTFGSFELAVIFGLVICMNHLDGIADAVNRARKDENDGEKEEVRWG